MANLENNQENNHKKSIPGKVGDQVQKGVQRGVDNVEQSVKDAAQFASDAVKHPVETAQEFGKQAAKDVTSYKWWAKLLLILFWSGLALVTAVFIALNLDATKEWAARQALQVLNQDFKAEMTTENIDVNYFGDVTVKGLRIKDYRGMEFIKAREFRAKSNWIALAVNALGKNKNSALSFDALALTNADIKVVTYKGDSISNFVRYIGLFDNGKKRDPNKPPFQLNSRVELKDSKVSIINRNSPGEKGKWLYATNLNLVAPSVKVNGGDVSAQINNFNFSTVRWGKRHTVDTFSADLSLTKNFLSLKDLTLNTDHSLLQGDIRFGLHDGSWSDFTDRVRWDMNLHQGSQVSGYDISYFATNWDNYKPFNISGKMSGPLNGFYLENFLLHNPDVNIATKTMKVWNLLKPNFQIETNTLSTDFTYKDLKAMMPGFISVKMKNFADDFGRIKFNGAARVNPKQIYVPKGNLVTGIGQAGITNFYLEDFSTPMPKYRGTADVTNLNTAVISKSKSVGLISGRFALEGRSFDVNTMTVRTRSQISSIQILDKTIRNVYLDGLLDKRTYKGIINVNDAQAAADVNGFIDFRTKRIAADILANVKHLNLNYFTGKPGSQIISGTVDGKMAMTDLNDLNLDATVKSLSFASGTRSYLIPQATVKTYFDHGSRIIDIDAPGAAQGKISGLYNLSDLSGMVQNGLSKILVGPPPRKLYRGQSFELNFDIQQGLAAFFAPDLRLPHGAKVSAAYDGNSNNLRLDADAEKIGYIMTRQKEITDADRALAAANPAYKITQRDRFSRDSAMINGLVVRINTANLEQQIYAKLERAEYNQNVFQDVTLTGRNENSSILHIAANFKHGLPAEEIDRQLKEYAININQTANSAGDYVFRFEPTEVRFNDIAWAVDTGAELNHSITYRKKSQDFLIRNLRIYSDESEILVNQAVFKSAKDFEADAVVKNLQISKLLSMKSGGNNNAIEGLANGTFKIRMNKSILEPIIDLTVQNITMNKKPMGDLVVSAKNSSQRNIFDLEAKVVSSKEFGNNSLLVSGTVNNNTSSPTLDLKADLKDFDIAFAQEFVNNVFSNLRGKATGLLSISGPLSDVNYNGDIGLKGFGLKLNFTGVDYSFEDTTIPLSKGLAVLNNIEVKDGRSNSHGTISGTIQFETLSSMGLNLIMRADNLLLLNSTQADSNLFWGRVYGQGDLFVSGPVSGLDISTPNMRALNNSTFTFNSNSTSNVDEFKMLRFLKEDNGIIVTEEKKNSGSNINADFTLTIDRGTQVNVLVGEDVGDISVRGTSEKLRFRMFRNGNLAMNGNYSVDSGTFVSKAILERTFQIEKGSSIRWDGDALSPQLDINANYLRTVTNAGQYLGVGSLQPINVLLTVKITETLVKPKVELGVSAPDVSSQLKETLASKMVNEDEKTLQFGSVLVMNSFNVANTGFDINVGNQLESSGYNMLFKQLGAVLNNISNEFQVDMNYLKGDQASNTGDRANASVTFALSPRVKVKTGLGVPLSKTENTSYNYLSGEGIIEYDWSRHNDGTRLLRAYSKPANIGLVAGNNGNPNSNQTYGVGVVYSKNFNYIFRGKKRKSAARRGAATIDSLKIDSARLKK